MTTPHMPSAEHPQFDAICAPVDDFETLPTVTALTSSVPVAETDWQPEEIEEDSETAVDESLDGLILAGLIAPY